jgi:hypothetical protein
MFIAKVDQDRQYRCIFYGCDNEGPVVAKNVKDEVVEPPTDPLAGLKGDEKKRAQELLVFTKFNAACGLLVDHESVTVRDAPDIDCTISGQPYYFELGRIVNTTVAAQLSPKPPKNSNPNFSFNQEEAFLEVLKTKERMRYGLSPVDLVLHFDRKLGSPWIAQALAEKHRDRLLSLTQKGPYQRVWIFDEHNVNIVALF